MLIWTLALTLLTGTATAFTYEDLRAIIERKGLNRIEQVLEQLPDEYHTHYTLMKESQSLQGATADAPRGILFGKEGKLILTFAGKPGMNRYETIEVIQFRDATQSFEFREIHFPAEANQTGPVTFSGANPPLCLSCHSQTPRPNWDRYPEWPGAYGSFDDFPKEGELLELKSFASGGMKQGRYRFLKTAQDSEATPYETKERGRLRFRPNFQLAALTFARQTDALAAQLARHPKYEKFWALFAMSRLQCDELDKRNLAEVLAELFGAAATAPLVPYSEPNKTNLYAYLIRGAGISGKKWKPALFANDGPKLDPYFFHCGLPRNLEDGDDGVIELSDLVMSRMVKQKLASYPELAPHFRYARWMEKRFGGDALSLPRARELDDILQIYDHAELKKACGLFP